MRRLPILLALLVSAVSSYAQISTDPAIGVLGQTSFTTRVAAVTESNLSSPTSVAVDPTTGKVFVVDRGNHRVLRWSSEAALVSGAAAEAVLGQPDFITKTTGLSATKFNDPVALTIDSQGRLYVSEYANNRVLRFDAASSTSTGAAADGVLGQPNFTTSTGFTRQNGMKGPVGLQVDADGRLWVSEFNNFRVVWFNNAAQKANGANADGVLGQPNFTTAVTGVTASAMNRPNGVYIDQDGRLWTSEWSNQRILRFDNAAQKANGAPADGVLGQPDFTSNAQNITRDGLTVLRGIWGDSEGRIYAIQENSARISIFEQAASKANGADADQVWGQPDFTTGSITSPPTASSLNYPRGIFIDEANNRMWIADNSNHRVLRTHWKTPDAPYLTMRAPFDGQECRAGLVCAVAWDAFGIDSIIIQFRDSPESAWVALDTVSASDARFNWLAPDEVVAEASIRLIDLNQPERISAMSGSFSIRSSQESVTLISPNGYQKWLAAGRRDILFESTDISTISIAYSLNNGIDWTTITTSHPAVNPVVSWTLPDAISSQARIKIWKTGDETVADTSEAGFELVDVLPGHPQDAVQFSDLPHASAYDGTSGTVQAPSGLVLADGRLPVTTDVSFAGNASLSLAYTSAVGGNWTVSFNNPDVSYIDVSAKDHLVFQVFSRTAVPDSVLPALTLTDTFGRKTGAVPMSAHVGSLPANEWTTVRIPIDAFRDVRGAVIMNRIRSINVQQNKADGMPNVLYLDDMRLTGGNIISGRTGNVIVVLGSSTSAGAGASPIDSAWVNRFRAYVLDRDPQAHVINLGVGGYNTYDILPTGLVPPSGRNAPKTENNITKALTYYEPDIILVNMPSNDASGSYTIDEQMRNFALLAQEAREGGADLWVTSTQPRNFANDAQRQNLMIARDSLMARFGAKMIDVWPDLAQADGRIRPEFDSGDGVHVNNTGHRLIYNRVVASGVWASLTQIEEGNLKSEIRFELAQNFPNPFNPTTVIRFNLTSSHVTRLTVFDVLGREVAVLVDGVMPAGVHSVPFDATGLATGVYLYRLEADGSSQVRRMVLVK